MGPHGLQKTAAAISAEDGRKAAAKGKNLDKKPGESGDIRISIAESDGYLKIDNRPCQGKTNRSTY